MGLAETCAIAVMAKAPKPGRVKTRLSPPLSGEQAMCMSIAFLRDVTENIACAGESAPIHGWIAYAPDGEAGLFDGMLAEGTQLVLADGRFTAPDGVEGFGRCLFQATETLLARGYGAACVLNSDSPTLPTEYLVALARALAEPGDRAVLGPAEDGGYYVLGVKRAHARLFADIAWSTDRVAAQTRERAREACVPLVELPEWYDVDDRAALLRLVRGFARGGEGYAADATASCVARLGIADLLTVEA